jgi:hypothetical protein
MITFNNPIMCKLIYNSGSAMCGPPEVFDRLTSYLQVICIVVRGSALRIFWDLSLATIARQPIFLSNGPYFFALYLLLGYLMDQVCTCQLGWG